MQYVHSLWLLSCMVLALTLTIAAQEISVEDALNVLQKSREDLVTLKNEQQKVCANVVCHNPDKSVCVLNDKKSKCVAFTDTESDVDKVETLILRNIARVGDSLAKFPIGCNNTDQCPKPFECFDEFCGGCNKRTDCPIRLLRCRGNQCSRDPTVGRLADVAEKFLAEKNKG